MKQAEKKSKPKKSKTVPLTKDEYSAVKKRVSEKEKQKDGEAMYYGLNFISNNLIICNRKNLTNPNGIIIGVPGSGKSFTVKLERGENA